VAVKAAPPLRWLVALLLAACSRKAPAPTRPTPLLLPPPTVHTSSIEPGPPLAATHYGAPLPASAALLFGREIWLATQAGIVRLPKSLLIDPAHARPIGIVGVSDGLPDAEILALRGLPNGQIEVATAAGLVRVDSRGRVRGPVRLAGQRVTALSSRLYGTWTGLFQSSGARVGSADFAITSLLDCGASTYVGTHEHGLFVYHAGSLSEVRGMPRVRIARLAGCSADRKVLAATTRGLFEVSGERARLISSWTRHATTVAMDGNDILVGTFGEGALRLSAHRDPAPLLVQGRVSLIEAYHGAILVGTDERLLVVRGAQVIEIPMDGPPAGLVTALAVGPDGTLWAGSFDRGLGAFDGHGWQNQDLIDPRVTALAFASDGTLYVGTASGLWRRNGERLDEVTDPRGWLGRHISAIRADGPRIYVAAYPGVVTIETDSYHYMGASGQEADAGLCGTTVNGIAVTPAGLWLGTQSGLTLLGPEPRWLTDLSGALPDNWVTDVRAAGDRLYVLTLRSGLLEISGQGARIQRFALMTSPSGLLPTSDGLLFGVNSLGLGFAPDAARIFVFGPAQGMTSSTVASLALDAAHDRLYVGGSNGIDRVDLLSRKLAFAKGGDHERPVPTAPDD
jgi:ligand-binding sensor domain-containing protein